MLTVRLVESGSGERITPIEDAQYWQLVRDLTAQLDAGPVRAQAAWMELGARIEAEAALRGWQSDSFFARLLQDVDAATATRVGSHSGSSTV